MLGIGTGNRAGVDFLLFLFICNKYPSDICILNFRNQYALYVIADAPNPNPKNVHANPITTELVRIGQ